MPLTAGRLPDDGRRPSVDLDAPVTIDVHARRWTRPRSRRRSRSTRRRRSSSHWDADRHRADDRPGAALGAGHLPHVTVQAGRPGRDRPAAASPARAAFLTREPRRRAIAATRAARQARRASRPPSRSRSTAPVDPASRRGRPSGSTRPRPGTLAVDASADGPPRYTFTPSRAAQGRTPLPARRRRRPRRRRRSRSSPSSLAVRTVDGAGRRPLPAARRRRRTSPATPRISVRFTEAMDRATTARRLPVTVERQGHRGHDHASPRTTRSSSSSRPRALPYGTRSSMAVGSTAHERRRRAAGQGGQGRRSGPIAKPDAPTTASRRRRSGGGRRRRRRRGRWRQLGAVETLLPRAHELHADRRLGHLGRPLQQPGRSQRRRRSSSTAGISTQGRAAVRQEARRRRRLQPLHRRQPGRPPAPGRLHELPLGREPRLPLGQPEQRRARLAPATSRARGRTTAATT